MEIEINKQLEEMDQIYQYCLIPKQGLQGASRNNANKKATTQSIKKKQK